MAGSANDSSRDVRIEFPIPIVCIEFTIERGDTPVHSGPALRAIRPSRHRLNQECRIEWDEIPGRMRYTPTTSHQSDLNLPESPD